MSKLEDDGHNLILKESKSSGSCKIDDIKSIIFGGCGSRFWMLRKHINSMSPQELKNLPFYSWNCLTLQLPHRDVDLVIKDEQEMTYVLNFLIYRMRTIDGNKDSALGILDALNKEAIQ